MKTFLWGLNNMHMQLSYSVLMCTYNGEKFILRQLESILSQTVIPNEIIIRDDCSSDSTLDVINECFSKFSFKNYKIIRNDNNIGWRLNFFSGIRDCNQSIILFSDQDDWHCKKAEFLLQAFNDNPIADAVFTKFTIGSKPVFFRTNSYQKYAKVKKYNRAKKWYYSSVPGCCLAIKREVALKYYNGNVPKYLAHDQLYEMILLLKNKLYVINNRLVYHYKHGGNASLPEKTSHKQRGINNCELMIENLSYVTDLLKDEKGEIIIEEISKSMVFFKKRLIYLNNPKFRYWLLQMLPNLKCYYNFFSFFADMPIFIKKEK